jgi:hypothetical protein
MRRSKWLFLVSFVVISSMLAWACGGGKEEKPSGPTAPVATSPAGMTPEVGETPTVGNTPEAQGGGSQFSDLAAKFGNATFKVTYQLSGTGAAVTNGSMTWYKKGDSLRMDITGEIEGQQTSAILIVRPDNTYVCSEMPGVGGGGSCFVAPSGTTGGAGDIVSEFQNTLTDPTINVLSTSSRNIAGEDATCYTVSAPDIEGQAEMCLTSEGVPLFTHETAGGVETTMEATDFSHDVSDSDFELPYPVSTLPSGTETP